MLISRTQITATKIDELNIAFEMLLCHNLKKYNYKL